MRTANKDGNTPLHFAAKAGGVPAIERRIRAGDDVNAQNNDGNAPLHIAFMYGKVEAAMALMGAGARADIPNREGKTANDYNEAV